jgi:hypothetical protein
MNRDSGSAWRKRPGISRDAPDRNAAYGMPQALAWNWGTIARTRSLGSRPTADGVHIVIECR